MLIIKEGSGDLARKTPTEVLVYQFDFTLAFPTTASIQTSVITAAPIRPSSATPLTLDTKTNDGSKHTSVRILGGTSGAIHKVTNVVTTDEAPDQIFEASFLLKIT